MSVFVLLDDKPLVMQQDLHPEWKSKLNVLKREKAGKWEQSVPQAFIRHTLWIISKLSAFTD